MMVAALRPGSTPDEQLDLLKTDLAHLDHFDQGGWDALGDRLSLLDDEAVPKARALVDAAFIASDVSDAEVVGELVERGALTPKEGAERANVRYASVKRFAALKHEMPKMGDEFFMWLSPAIGYELGYGNLPALVAAHNEGLIQVKDLDFPFSRFDKPVDERALTAFENALRQAPPQQRRPTLTDRR